MHLAIIGPGRWGRILVEAVQGISQTVDFTRAVARSPAKAADWCAAQGLSLGAELSDVLADPQIGGIVLATPHSQHADQIAAAAQAGKHVFCEKPVTLTRASAEAAMQAVRDAGVVFAAGHNRRFLPAMERMMAMIARGDLGTILHIEGNMSGHVGARYTPEMWRVDPVESPAGGLAGSGIHVIDAMIHLLGPITTVTAQSDRLVNEIDLDDTTNMLFRFESRATGYLTAMTATAPIFRMQVFGDKGWLELRGETDLAWTPVEGVREVWTYPGVSTERLQLESFAESIRTGTPYPISLEDVINGIAVFEAVSASVKSGGPIRL
ncbi:MAG: Gfo/Idh/MocA family oxidoreductase [Proteobacteria bacterium]|nr:Gfo/Idh/MocA family oxidoreductase [Pseudomonadota bacterium]